MRNHAARLQRPKPLVHVAARLLCARLGALRRIKLAAALSQKRMKPPFVREEQNHEEPDRSNDGQVVAQHEEKAAAAQVFIGAVFERLREANDVGVVA